MVGLRIADCGLAPSRACVVYRSKRLAYHITTDFSARISWKVVNDEPVLRNCLSTQSLKAPGFEVFQVDFRSIRWPDRRGDRFTARRVGNAEYAGLGNRRVALQQHVDLGRLDFEPRTID